MLRPEDSIPGTLVECIDAQPGEWPDALPIRKGGAYVVAGLKEGFVPNRSKKLGVALVGFAPDCFSFHRFRLLPDERLSIFRQMLAPAPKQTERV